MDEACTNIKIWKNWNMGSLKKKFPTITFIKPISYLNEFHKYKAF